MKGSSLVGLPPGGWLAVRFCSFRWRAGRWAPPRSREGDSPGWLGAGSDHDHRPATPESPFFRTMDIADDGTYTLDGVDPGTYTLSVAAKGLEIAPLQNLVLADGQPLKQDLTLTPAHRSASSRRPSRSRWQMTSTPLPSRTCPTSTSTPPPT